MGSNQKRFHIQREEATVCGVQEKQVVCSPDMGGEFHTQEAVKTGKYKHNIRIWSAGGGGAGDGVGKVIGGPAYQWFAVLAAH